MAFFEHCSLLSVWRVESVFMRSCVVVLKHFLSCRGADEDQAEQKKRDGRIEAEKSYAGRMKTADGRHR